MAIPLKSENLAKLKETSPSVALPKYDRVKTKPGMVHIGVGNFHRAHQCVFLDDALSLPGHESWGYIGIGLMPSDIKMRDAMKGQDTLYTIWEKGVSDAKVRVVGCHQDMILAPEDPEAAVSLLSDSAIKVVTLTVTEKGYFIDFGTGHLDRNAGPVKEDIANLKSIGTDRLTSSNPLKTASGYLVCASRRRMASGTCGFTVLSCDNVQENGEKAQLAVLEMAEAVDPSVAAWMKKNVTFPNSMVDRITPVTTDEMKSQLASEHKIQDNWPVVCEQFLLWVVEDKFPYGRPEWEKSASGKCILTDDVVPYELMKLRLLNAVHQALSYPASLLGHELVHDSMADNRVLRFLKQYMAAAAKTCKNVKGLDKEDWCNTVIDRFSNPAIRDTILRLTEDATNRIGVALAPCLHGDAVGGSNPLGRSDTEAILLPVSCWIRCLLGDTVGPFPVAAKLNQDDKMDKVKGPAATLWAHAKSGEAVSRLQEDAATFLRTAFSEQAARPEVASILVEQVKTLQRENGVQALLASLGSEAIPLRVENFAKIKEESPSVALPKYDKAKVKSGMVHIGVGNFHRAHQCVFLDDALSLPGHESWGYAGVGLMPSDVRMRDILKAQDTLYTLWEKGVSEEKVRIMGCHQDMVLAPEDPETAVSLLSASTMKIATMTVTEKGYFIDFGTGHLDTHAKAVQDDIANLKSLGTNRLTSRSPLKTAAGYLVCASRRRMASGTCGFTVLSCDNVQENGEKAQLAVLEMAEAVDPSVAAWMKNNVTFPNSMVDRITPVTTDEMKSQLASEHKIQDSWPVVCEQFLLWVVEDKFPYGRPEWEKSTSGKCILTDDVVPYELMKLRLLNAVHQALSYPASLLGHELVHDSMADDRVLRFLKQYMAAAAKTCPNVKGLDKSDWCKTVIDRFSNPAIRDTILRLTEDATNRIGVALAPCLHGDAVGGSNPLGRSDTEAILLPVSCWIRCLLGDTVGPFPASAKLNKDDKMEKVKGLAATLWEHAKNGEGLAAKGDEVLEDATKFLRIAFSEQAARPEVASILVQQVKILQNENGVQALLASLAGDAIPLTVENFAMIKEEAPSVVLPKYDRAKVKSGMVHIGVGNFHRAHQCVFLDDALSLPGHESWGYAGVGLMPSDARMRDVMKSQNSLYTLWEKGVSEEKVRVMGCHQDMVLAPEDPEAAVSLLSASTVKIATMTVTEKGYFIDFGTGHLDRNAGPVQEDIANLKSLGTNRLTSRSPLKTAAGYLVCASRRRMASGTSGFTVLSCDNVQENGEKAQLAVLEMAEAIDPSVAAWMKKNVTFPNSMVDRITPVTTDEIRSQLASEHKIQDSWPVVCEQFLLWVVEDKFPYGRPEWEKSTSGKCILTDNVVPYELMKLRLLNAVHQALSYPASLLGHELVHDSMADDRVLRFLKQYMTAAAKTCPNVKGLDKNDWCKTVIDRFSNPAIRDTILRLTEDATNRIGVALAPCLHGDAVGGNRPLSRSDTQAILLPVSCWIRCLLGDTVGPFPEAAKLNRDDKMEKVKGPAATLWAHAKSGEATSRLQEDAAKFLRIAFSEQAARPEVASILVEQVKTLQSENGVQALLASLGGEAIPLKVENFAKIKEESPSVVLPKYDRAKVKSGMVHIGVGNFHRAHQCVFLDDALSLPGHESWGYAGVGLMPSDVRMRDILKAQDNLYTLWEKGVSEEKVRIMGCHQDMILAPEDPESAVSLLSASTTKVATMTVTEKGYFIDFGTGHLDRNAGPVKDDIANLISIGTDRLTSRNPLKTAAGYLVCASRRRMASGTCGFTVLSCDNVQENGEKAQLAVIEMAEAVDPSVAGWMKKNVTFPNSMVDRITPVTTDDMRAQLASEHKIQDSWPVVCEQFLLWVVEDKFPYGRPEWEKSTSGKCILTDDVVPYELMKLRLLNAVHQALSYPASLLGHELVHDSMADDRVLRFLKQYMAAAAKTCPNVKGLDKDDWCKTVIDRFSNPAIRDTILRLTEDATNRIGVALAPCLHGDAVGGSSPLDRLDTEAILVPVSCWIRCLLGDSVGPFPAAAKLNRDDKMEKVKGPAATLWAQAKTGEASSKLQESASMFLRTAFSEQAARPEVASILVEQVKTLQRDNGVQALLLSIGGSASDSQDSRKLEMISIFREFDEKGNGSIPAEEFRALLVFLGIPKASISSIVESVGSNRDGSISYIRFIDWMF